MVDASLRMSIVDLFKGFATSSECRSSTSPMTSPPRTTSAIAIMIMQRGKVVEAGPARQVLSNPQHPYTVLLKESVLSSDDVDKVSLGTEAPVYKGAAD